MISAGDLLTIIYIFGALTLFLLFVIIFRALLHRRIELQSRLRKFEARGERPEIMRRERGKSKRRGFNIPKQRLVKLETELYAANIMFRADEFIVCWFLITLLLPGLMLFFGAELIACTAMLLICAAAPITVVQLVKRRRLAKIDTQLADALTVMCGALRAGFSFQKALETISAEMPDPIGREFGRVAREIGLGMPMETSFARLIERTKNTDLEMICSAVLIQKQVGGNLAEVLDNVGDTIRQRLKVKGDIKVLTATGTMSGYVIGLLPVCLLLILMVISPDYIEPFFTTAGGRKMMALGVILEIIGFTLVRKTVSIKV
ncbi:MAG: type II secretion system F family protein [Bacillota bacterium]|nr:type II secretion system F family protein [Bacillota bacterium]